MQQFNATFINTRIIPLLEDMLADTAAQKTKHLTPLFMGGELAEENTRMLASQYFLGKTAQGVPFGEEKDQKDREIFLKYFGKYIQSRSSEPDERVKLFLPQVNAETGAVTWPEEVKRNLYLLAHDIGQKIEQQTLQTLISKKTEFDKKKKDEQTALLKEGRLILSKASGSAEFDTYLSTYTIGAADAPESTTVFFPEPLPDPANISQIQWQDNIDVPVYGRPLSDVSDVISTKDDLQNTFKACRAVGTISGLSLQTLTVVGSMTVNANHQLLATVRTMDGEILSIMADIAVPMDEPLKLEFEFKNGPYQGEKFTVRQDQLFAAFQDENGAPISAKSAFEKIKKQKEQIAPITVPAMQPAYAPHVMEGRSSRISPRPQPSEGPSHQVPEGLPITVSVAPAPFIPTRPPEKNVAFPIVLQAGKIKEMPTVQDQKRKQMAMKKTVSGAKITASMPEKSAGETHRVSPADASKTQPAPQPTPVQTEQDEFTPPAKKKFPWKAAAVAAAVGAGPIIGAGTYVSAVTNVLFFS